MATKRVKHLYVQAFGVTVMLLALVRCIFPGVAGSSSDADAAKATTENGDSLTQAAKDNTKVSKTAQENDSTTTYHLPVLQKDTETEYLSDGAKPHPVKSVLSYAECFPDSNHVQLEAAHYWGVPPVKDRKDAEDRKDEVVFMGSSPYYSMAHLDSSIPYLVPRASLLLQDIGRNFFDSLQVKGLPLHRIVVSSVLRSQADVARLRRSNKNATEQSCHLYGTTFDINYNQYIPVDSRHTVGSDKLKWVLSEVLRDLRQQERCYIKYEVRQPCFHITVR